MPRFSDSEAERLLRGWADGPPTWSARAWKARSRFSAALADLAGRRARRYGRVLASAVEDFDRRAEALAARVVEVDSGARTVIHGDLVLPNLLTSTGTTVDAVLDWGFLSTEGDPVFEATVTASIVEMYGDDALETELDLYRAAYSLITANAYDPDGGDGHFAWCAAALNRPDVVAALRA